MLKRLWMGFALAASLLVAGCGGDSEPAIVVVPTTIVGTYAGTITLVVPGVGTLNGPANLSIGSSYAVTGSWNAVQTPPGSTTVVVFTGSSTAGGAVTASGYDGATEVMRLAGNANASTGVISGSYVLASGFSGTFSLSK